MPVSQKHAFDLHNFMSHQKNLKIPVDENRTQFVLARVKTVSNNRFPEIP